MIMTVRVRVLTMKGTVRSVRRRLQLLLGVPSVQRNTTWTWPRRATWAAIICPYLIGRRSRRLPLMMYN